MTIGKLTLVTPSYCIIINSLTSSLYLLLDRNLWSKRRTRLVNVVLLVLIFKRPGEGLLSFLFSFFAVNVETCLVDIQSLYQFTGLEHNVQQGMKLYKPCIAISYL